MKEYICQIVPVYVRPQPLTDEKACIGVIVRCPETSFADYRIVEANSASADRIASFFPRFGRENLARAIEGSRHDIAFSLADEREAGKRFANLIRPRENVVQYGIPLTQVLTDVAGAANRIYEMLVA